MEDDGDGDDASLRARSRRGVRATVAKRRRMDDSIDPSSLGVDVASASPSSARGGDASRAPRGRTAREIAATLGVSLPFDHREGDSAAAAVALRDGRIDGGRGGADNKPLVRVLYGHAGWAPGCLLYTSPSPRD